MALIQPANPPGIVLWAVRSNNPYQQTVPMKLIKLISLGLIALCLGACASKPSQQGSVSTTNSGTMVIPAK